MQGPVPEAQPTQPQPSADNQAGANPATVPNTPPETASPAQGTQSEYGAPVPPPAPEEPPKPDSAYGISYPDQQLQQPAAQAQPTPNPEIQAPAPEKAANQQPAPINQQETPSQQPAIHEPTSAKEAEDLKNFEVSNADVVKGAPVAGADTSSPEFPGGSQENLSSEASTEKSVFKGIELDPVVEGKLTSLLSLYYHEIEISNGDPDVKNRAGEALTEGFVKVQDSMIDFSRKEAPVEEKAS